MTLLPGNPARIIVDANEILRDSEVHLNVREKYIITTEDKVRLCLSKRLATMEQRKDWIAPAGILLAVVTVFVSAEFKDAGISRHTWQAIFIIVGWVSLGWLIWALVRRRNAPTLDDVVIEIKVGTVTTTPSPSDDAPPVVEVPPRGS